MKKFAVRLLEIAAAVYGLLFLIFYYDIDGKLIFYVWEPLICKKYDKMKRKDTTATPYEVPKQEAGAEATR